MTAKKFNPPNLESLIQSKNIERVSYDALVGFFLEDKLLQSNLPDNISEVDPRNGNQVLFVSKRGERPHDNKPTKSGANTPCPICLGNTTKIVDLAKLSEGFTFINKNLYPVVFPFSHGRKNDIEQLIKPTSGMHFLQWTSNEHDKDFHNLPLEDSTIVLSRLAALEKSLMQNQPSPSRENCHVSITKNFGHLVGGSLSHGHQQIIFNQFVPTWIEGNKKFAEINGEFFTNYLLRENPANLIIKDYGSVTLIVPYFMRRPYEMLLVLKNTSRKYLYNLTWRELEDSAKGWHDAINMIQILLPEIGRDLAYNVIINNGPGAGLYFEILPYTQAYGGFEHLGLFACQTNPIQAAARLRKILKEIG